MVRGAVDCTAASLPSGTPDLREQRPRFVADVSRPRVCGHSDTWHVTKTKKGAGLRPHPRVRIERRSRVSDQLTSIALPSANFAN
jgi:hypothetical protein